MSDFSELKKLAEAAQAFPFADEACEFQALSDFYDGCDPAEVLVLIAENEALTKRLEVDPRHSYDGIATRDATIKVLDEQLDQIKAECEGLRESLTHAADEVESWGAYASDYFQQKHDLAGTVLKVRQAAVSKESGQ